MDSVRNTSVYMCVCHCLRSPTQDFSTDFYLLGVPVVANFLLSPALPRTQLASTLPIPVMEATSYLSHWSPSVPPPPSLLLRCLYATMLCHPLPSAPHPYATQVAEHMDRSCTFPNGRRMRATHAVTAPAAIATTAWRAREARVLLETTTYRQRRGASLVPYRAALAWCCSRIFSPTCRGGPMGYAKWAIAYPLGCTYLTLDCHPRYLRFVTIVTIIFLSPVVRQSFIQEVPRSILRSSVFFIFHVFVPFNFFLFLSYLFSWIFMSL
jgi:hypothetical protein